LYKFKVQNTKQEIVLINSHWRNKNMAKYECTVCGYVYDEDEGDADSGIAPGTKFEDLPDDWVCPVCGAGKGDFEIL